MAQYRCTQCGSVVEAPEGVKVGQCPSCGALFVFPNDFPQKAVLYRRAADMRNAGNFAAACVNYGRILKIDAMETEAHWGYLLSRYGVEILGGGDSGQVLFHRLEALPFTEDPSYGKMLEYCPPEARYYYEGMARKIQAMHTKMLEIARRQGDFDIYLNCTQEKGTQAWLLANQVGKALDSAGYRVFLPCTMLENVPKGEENLYEMAAAEKSSAMLVAAAPGVDFKEPRLAASWKRYWELSQEDGAKKLLSVYRDIDPGKDLPMELSALQAINCGVPAFEEEVVRQVGGMFGRGGRSADMNRKILELLRQGQAALKEKRFPDAQSLFDKASSLDREEGAAYWGLVRSMTEDLTAPAFTPALDTAYQRALQFAGDKQKAQYRGEMRALMAEPAWSALEKAAGGFADYSLMDTGEYDLCKERARLYMPRDDKRLERIKAYENRAAREWEAEKLCQRYKNRDIAAQPLFAQQKQAEDIFLSRGRLRMAGKTGPCWPLLLAAAAFLMAQVVHTLRLGQPPGNFLLHWGARALFVLGAAGLVWAALEALPRFRHKTLITAGAGLALVIAAFKLGTIIYLLAIPLALFLLLLVQALRLLSALHAKRDEAVREKALKELQEADRLLKEAYQADVEALNREYGTPGAPAPAYAPSHGFPLSAGKAKGGSAKGILSFGASALLALGCVVGALLVSNLVYAGGWHDVASLSSSYYTVLGIREDGTVAANGYNGWERISGVGSWKNITQTATGICFTAGLREDGTVAVSCRKDLPYKAAEEWTDIVQISGMSYCLAGLKSDGTCVAVGENEQGECNVEGWEDVKEIRAAGTGKTFFTIALQNSGSVLCTQEEYQNFFRAAQDGLGPFEKVYGKWASFVVSSQSGSMHGVGSNGMQQLEGMGTISSEGVADVSAADLLAVLYDDGTVEAWGRLGFDLEQLAQWKNITAISGGFENLLGLREDGTVASFGKNDWGQNDVEGWEDISAITAGQYASFGLRRDKTVEAAGQEDFGLCYVQPKSLTELVSFWIGSMDWAF